MSDLKTLGRVSPSGKYIIETRIPLQDFFPGSLNRFEG